MMSNSLTITIRNAGNLVKHYSSSSSFALMYKTFGEPKKVIEKVDVTETVLNKKLKADELLVQFMACPVNPADINTVQGVYGIKPPLPAIGGNEGVAKVVEVGSDIKKLKPGDWVIPSAAGSGTWKTHGIGTERGFLYIPQEGLDVLSVAQLTVNPCTAYRMLKDFVDLKPGQSVVQNGANSAVGTNVIQLAREWGLKTINVIRSRPEAELNKMKSSLKQLGADYVLTEEELRKPEVTATIFKDIPKPKLALNCVGGKNATNCSRLLDFRGVMVTYGGMSKQPLEIPTGSIIFKDLRFEGFWTTRWTQEHVDHPERSKMFNDLCELLKQGRLKAPKTYPFKLENFHEAFDKAMSGFVEGKVVFVMD